MANIAIIIAGGSGHRMGQDIPKQFINVYDKPILIYTLESFQKHPQIDAIEVVCIDGWHDILWAYAKQFNIDKLKWVVSGGSTGQESIRNGVYSLEGKANPDDTVIIHDGIRPLVEPSVLTDVISKCKQYGNAVTSMPYNEQIFVVDKENEATTTQYIPRETLRRVSTPQAYKFDLLDRKYHEAFEKEIGIYGSSYTNTMMVELGERLYFAAGSDKNIKLTTKDDLEMFKESIINAYAAKSGLSHARIANLMSNETWMNAKKAVELGFADEILFAKKEEEPDSDPADPENPEEAPDSEPGEGGEEKPFQKDTAGHLFSSRQMDLIVLNRLGVKPEDVGQKHTEPKEPPADPKPSAEPTPQVEPPANPGPVLDMDGKTEDGSIPYNILMKQLECMK